MNNTPYLIIIALLAIGCVFAIWLAVYIYVHSTKKNNDCNETKPSKKVNEDPYMGVKAVPHHMI